MHLGFLSNCLNLHNIYGYFSSNIFNSLWPYDAIWWHKAVLTLAHIMACCLSAPSHCLNQSWLTINKVRWNSREIPQPSITETSWKIINLKSHLNLQKTNELGSHIRFSAIGQNMSSKQPTSRCFWILSTRCWHFYPCWFSMIRLCIPFVKFITPTKQHPTAIQFGSVKGTQQCHPFKPNAQSLPLQ